MRRNRSDLRKIWDRLKDAAGVITCEVCEIPITDVLAQHSQKLTGINLCIEHLHMYLKGKIQWDGDRFVETD